MNTDPKTESVSYTEHQTLPFVLNNSDHANHAALARAIRSHLRWRNSHKRDLKLLDAERKERLRVRSEARRQWGHPRAEAA